MDDVNRIFQKYLTENAGRPILDFGPLLSRHPHLREALEKKIETYEKVLGALGNAPVEDESSSVVGRDIGGCKIIRVLGQGARSVSYLGWSEKIGHDVVIKVLQPSVFENEVLKERFLREIRTISRLDHKNMIPVYDVGEERGSLFIVMKHLEGLPLSLLIRKISEIDRSTLKMINIASALGGKELDRFKTPTEFFCTLLLQTAEAVQYAHDHGVIHRNINSSNIIVDPDGAPVLLDFGLGPFENNRLIDVHSLGTTLYEAVTGGLPYEDDGKEPVRPKERWNDIPPDLEKIIDTAMAKDAEFRYPSAAAFRDDLGHFLSYLPVQAKPPPSIRRLARRSRWVLAVGSLIGVLSLGAYYFYGQAGPDHEDHGRITTANEELNQEKLKSLMQGAINSLGSNDYAAAFHEVDKIYKLYPDNTSVAVWYYGLRSKIDRDIWKFKESISALEKKHPGDLYVRLAKIVIYYEEKDHERGSQEKRIIFENLNDAAIWRHLPTYLSLLGVPQSLILEFLEAGLKKYPQDADLNFAMNSFCAKNPKYDICLNRGQASRR